MHITQKEAKILAKIYNINLKSVPLKEWTIGLNTELEHANIIKNLDTLVKIVIAHLEEDNRYYKYLSTIEEKRKNIPKKSPFI